LVSEDENVLKFYFAIEGTTMVITTNNSAKKLLPGTNVVKDLGNDNQSCIKVI